MPATSTRSSTSSPTPRS
uniref:Uncharacterized protein n=1 Tax=Arundo donax TaxID=35708 RepID=A0A0A9AT94_ARUDO